jgi:hypothetical protein
MPIQVVGSEIASFGTASAVITTEASIVATSSATGTTCISTGQFGVVNAGNYWVEVFTPYLTKGTTNLDIELFEGASAAAGTFLTTLTGHMVASSILGAGITLVALVNLTAAAHTLTVTGFVDAGTGKFGAGTGTTGNAPPARIQVVTA